MEIIQEGNKKKSNNTYCRTTYQIRKMIWGYLSMVGFFVKISGLTGIANLILPNLHNKTLTISVPENDWLQ